MLLVSSNSGEPKKTHNGFCDRESEVILYSAGKPREVPPRCRSAGGNRHTTSGYGFREVFPADGKADENPCGNQVR